MDIKHNATMGTLDSLRVVNFRFLESGVYFTTRCHELPRVTIHVTIYVTVLLSDFCSIFNSYYFENITRSFKVRPPIQYSVK